MNHVGLANCFLLGNPDFTKEHDGRYIAGHYTFDLLLGQLASIAYMSETKRKGCFKRQIPVKRSPPLPYRYQMGICALARRKGQGELVQLLCLDTWGKCDYDVVVKSENSIL